MKPEKRPRLLSQRSVSGQSAAPGRQSWAGRRLPELCEPAQGPTRSHQAGALLVKWRWWSLPGLPTGSAQEMAGDAGSAGDRPQTGPSEMVGGYRRPVTGQKSMMATSIGTSAAFSHVLGKGGGAGGILGIISKKARGGGWKSDFRECSEGVHLPQKLYFSGILLIFKNETMFSY